MSNSEDNVQKLNGLGSDPMQRLASFKAPRDLSLGGIKPNKKVFTPNLNVTRNKNKGPSYSNARDQKKDDKGRKDRRNDKNKNFNKFGQNVIKSSGVFSEGMGSAERTTSKFSYRDSDSGGNSAATLQRPTIRVKDVIKIDKELEEQRIKSVTGDISILDDTPEDFKHVNEKDAPIKLPMDNGVTSVEQKLPHVKKEVFEDTDVVNALRSDKATLLLLQLPDSLPGRGGSVDDQPRRRTNEAPSTSAGEEEVPVDNSCRLADLEEGKIGKLRIHQSGRVSLLLGDTVFEVSSGTKGAFHQEVVSLAVDDSSRSANLVALGPLQYKLNLVPNWETMFQDMPV